MAELVSGPGLHQLLSIPTSHISVCLLFNTFCFFREDSISCFSWYEQSLAHGREKKKREQERDRQGLTCFLEVSWAGRTRPGAGRSCQSLCAKLCQLGSSRTRRSLRALKFYFVKHDYFNAGSFSLFSCPSLSLFFFFGNYCLFDQSLLKFLQKGLDHEWDPNTCHHLGISPLLKPRTKMWINS